MDNLDATTYDSLFFNEKMFTDKNDIGKLTTTTSSCIYGKTIIITGHVFTTDCGVRINFGFSVAENTHVDILVYDPCNQHKFYRVMSVYEDPAHFKLTHCTCYPSFLTFKPNRNACTFKF